MSDLTRFVIFMIAACVVFIAVLLFTTRKRMEKPSVGLLLVLMFIVVVIGMLFARYSHIFFQPPWWIYYGLPAVVTLFVPPAILRMRPREIMEYIPLAVLMAPAIHGFFSLFVGWHDYMPFPVYIPSIRELF